MRIFDLLVAFAVVVVLSVALLNPGGWVVAGVIAGAILLVRFGGPFVRDIVIARNKGWKGRKRDSKSSSMGMDNSQSNSSSGMQRQESRR